MQMIVKKSTPRIALLLLITLCIPAMDSSYLQAQNRTEAQYNRTISWYDFDAVADLLDLKTGDWLADIGTRNGFYLKHFLPALGESGHIFAVDIDQQGFDSLHESMVRWSYANISTIYSKETNPLLPANSLDAIFIRNAYHEFSEPKQMLSHIKKALKPGGRLVISEPMREIHQDRERSEQEGRHVLDIEFALQDLEEMGFRVDKKVQNFAQTPSRRTTTIYWLLVATPISDRAD